MYLSVGPPAEGGQAADGLQPAAAVRAHLHCRQGPGLQDEAQQVSPDSGAL